MKKATRKIYLSILFVGLSLLTMVATTFAWVGIISNASFEKFTINLETDNEESDYGVMLSLTGEENDFHDSIEPLDIQRQILVNMGVEKSYLNNEANIKNIFNEIGLALCTTSKENNNPSSFYLNDFTTLNGEKPYASLASFSSTYKGYFEFDVWISIYKIGEDAEGSEKKLSVYLKNGDDGLFSSKVTEAFVVNEISMPSSSNPLSSQYLKSINNFEPGKKIQGAVLVNPAGAARLSVQKATAVAKYDNTSYSNRNYKGLKIYKYGKDLPYYNQRTNVYDFGGILPSDFNFARILYNATYPENQLPEVPENVINRGDISFIDDGVTNHIVESSDNVTTENMIKLHFNFWFEGWDADCFEVVDGVPVSINLNFSTKEPVPGN